MRRAKAALLVEGPEEAGIRRWRTRRMRRRLLTQIGSQNIFRLRSFAVLCGRKRLIARGAQSRSRHQKPARASRPGDADAAQVDAGQAPVDHKAHLLETRRSPKGSVAARRRRRRADGPSPRTSRASSASRSLAPNKASMAGLALTTKPGGDRIASRALSFSHSSGASSRSKAAAACSRDSGVRSAADDGGEWVKVGAREWTSNRRSRDSRRFGLYR